MIRGSVNADWEGRIPLVVFGAGGTRKEIQAVVDTGFTGQLTLPPPIISSLGLTWLGIEEGILADGSVEVFHVYSTSVMWDGQTRPGEVDAMNAEPLVGMKLLGRHSLQMNVIPGGDVTIAPLP
jgi:clan AA aspartic protease